VIDGMRVILVDRETKVVTWETTALRGPGSLASLPNGDYLVAERKYIARIDKDGKLISRSPATFGFLTDIKVLENGHLLVSDQDKKTVAEIDWDGKISWSITGLHAPSEAVRLANGNTLVADGTAVLKEFDAANTLVRSVQLRQWAASIQPLPNGLLVGEQKGVEFLDTTGKVVWSIDLPSRITGVQRLAEDEYLIAEPDVGRVVIINSGGYIKWELTGLHLPWHAIYVA
jgi:outer membrane protein assembly factor BamB